MDVLGSLHISYACVGSLHISYRTVYCQSQLPIAQFAGPIGPWAFLLCPTVIDRSIFRCRHAVAPPGDEVALPALVRPDCYKGEWPTSILESSSLPPTIFVRCPINAAVLVTVLRRCMRPKIHCILTSATPHWRCSASVD